MAIFRDDDVVLDTDAANAPVTFQNVFVDVLTEVRGGEIGVDDEAAEIDL